MNKLKSNSAKHKNQIDKLDKRNVVYVIPCPDSDTRKTSKTVKSRITEHKNAVEREDPRSLLANHGNNNDHRIKLDKNQDPLIAKTR